jgi:uncharacterized protein (TIGR03083 family)
MEISAHIEALHREGVLLAEAAAATPLDAAVPTCPGWRLRDLLLHTGQVHRWAAAHVRDGLEKPLDAAGEQAARGPAPDDADLPAWFRAGHTELVGTLERAPADLACWSFLPAPSPLAFWARRQAHETAVHRVDAESAAGRAVTPVGAEAAEDGIDELLNGFLVRPRSKLRSERPRTLLVRPADRARAWLVTVSADPVRVAPAPVGTTADCTVAGPAADLYLLLWNRLAPDAVQASGDRSLLDLWRETAHVRWS